MINKSVNSSNSIYYDLKKLLDDNEEVSKILENSKHKEVLRVIFSTLAKANLIDVSKYLKKKRKLYDISMSTLEREFNTMLGYLDLNKFTYMDIKRRYDILDRILESLDAEESQVFLEVISKRFKNYRKILKFFGIEDYSK